MRAEGFSCSMDVLYGGLGISRLQFFLSTNYGIKFFFFAEKFVQFLGHKNPGSGSVPGIQPKMLDLDPVLMNVDPKH